MFSDSSRNDTHLLLKSFVIYCTLPLLYLPWTGIASGLPTNLRHTLHIALVQVATPTVVVGGKDVEEQDTSKQIFLFIQHNCSA